MRRYFDFSGTLCPDLPLLRATVQFITLILSFNFSNSIAVTHLTEGADR